MIAILAVVYGVIGIIVSIANKSFGIGFMFCILSVAFGIAMCFLPLMPAITNRIFARLAAGWIVMQGLVSIIAAIQVRRFLLCLMGVIGILLGIYTFLHPVLFGILFAWLLGILIGVYFIQAGISLLFLPSKGSE